ncbi:hypothetical protein PVAND_007809 [Polypedilum vanderplanki]|uniref:Cuticle protein n=1 Tax=Polypedilum vanderplanki TaxID=319348 RepID=A0A9J6C7H1_POLVA|nr:hypothetical protein PVAND_007809 [Polypedilum vanderplanki]
MWIVLVTCDEQKKESPSNQVNQVNSDGTFHFGYENKDQGAHYHKATGSVVKVRGRYGSRNPATSRIDETVYTAGPRGYRARGTNIHRKQNLSQVRRGPIGSSTDPLADPLDDPSYAFGFKTKTHSRREEADSSGKVHGEFIYVDDAGDKHGVKYNAAAHTGFSVENGVPDSTINYNAPLYKTDPTARGKISFERGPDRQYKFLTSSPDQRRAESTGSDGVTRGSYSYLDDKGVQRTVQYIAGAGIGYRVVSSTVGPGTHVSANADVPEYSIKAVSNEIAISDDPSHYHPTGPSAPGYITSTQPPPTYVTTTTPSSYPQSTFSTAITSYYASTPRPFSRPSSENVYISTPSSIGDINRHGIAPTVSTSAYPSASGPNPISPSGPDSSNEDALIYGLLPPKEEAYHTKQYVPPTPTIPSEVHITPAVHHPTHRLPLPPSVASPTTFFYPTQGYLPTESSSSSPYSYIPTQPTIAPSYQIGPHPDAVHFNPSAPQSPVNAGTASSGWFFGLAPGAGKRAHIQNIDLIAAHERALSPSEALRRDEEREAYQVHPHEQEHHHHHLSSPIHYLRPPRRT